MIINNLEHHFFTLKKKVFHISDSKTCYGYMRGRWTRTIRLTDVNTLDMQLFSELLNWAALKAQSHLYLFSPVITINQLELSRSGWVSPPLINLFSSRLFKMQDTSCHCFSVKQ